MDDASLLYLSDSADSRVLKVDTREKQCETCYVNSYRLGFVSLRQPAIPCVPMRTNVTFSFRNKATTSSKFIANARGW